MTDGFATALLGWYDRHGRKDLPWQQNRDAYAIWVSEIMLQQTQVTTVIPYYERFLARFPTVEVLASAPRDDVLHHWTGLGYYARARNLHRAAQIIANEHSGQFPADLEQACALPGVGRSTAGAILDFAYGQRHPILDGNVKRVLCRYHGIDEPPGKRAVEQRLWALATEHTPARRVADYTQAIMDLGATVCRRRPLCAACPLHDSCVARRRGNPGTLPMRIARQPKPVRRTRFVMIRDLRRVLLEQRPPTGIWGGMWGFPEVPEGSSIERHVAREFGLTIRSEPPWQEFRHTFTHFHLDITPVPARLNGDASSIMEKPGLVWYNLHSPDARGLAAPVKQLLIRLNSLWDEP